MYWGVKGAEETLVESQFDAVESYLDDLSLDQMPETLTVQGFVPRKPTVGDCGRVLQRLIEDLEEEYGNPDGDCWTPTQTLRDAEQVFLKAVLAEYQAFACEPFGDSVIIVVRDWVQENRPDWLLESP